MHSLYAGDFLQCAHDGITKMKTKCGIVTTKSKKNDYDADNTSPPHRTASTYTFSRILSISDYQRETANFVVVLCSTPFKHSDRAC